MTDETTQDHHEPSSAGPESLTPDVVASASGRGATPYADDRLAIVGMSCLYPGSPDVETFWSNILGKVDCTGYPEQEEAWMEDFYAPGQFDDEKIYCRRGGYLGSLATFDPMKFRIPPKSVGGEPDQWLALRVAEAALADANALDLPPEVRRRTGIVLGKGTYLNGGNAILTQRTIFLRQNLRLVRRFHPEWSDEILEETLQMALKELPEIGPDIVASLIPNVIVGRIANRMDFMGPAYTIDAACASSLVALQAAKRHLLSGECDVVLTGGSQVWIPSATQNLFCRIRAMSPTETIRPFAADADGTLLGEGLGMIVLKRLADAERDGDRIYAVVRGVGVSSDGAGAGVMAPQSDGQVEAMRRAYADAGVDPATVELVEAHGTATQIGDPVELHTLNEVYGKRSGRFPDVAVGTVKSNISHTIPAAGVAGLIKASLALHHKVLPPTINVDTPHPAFDDPDTSLYLNAEARPWVHPGATPRRAGINAFGFGGINSHAVLEEYQGPSNDRGHLPTWESEVFAFEAADPAALSTQLRDLATKVEACDETLDLTDLAAALARRLTTPGRTDTDTGTTDTEAGSTGTLDRPVRLAIVADSAEQLVTKLGKAADRLEAGDVTRIRGAAGIFYEAEPLALDTKVALMCPGEGSQYPGMLQDLCLHFPEVMAAFDISEQIGTHERDERLSDWVFPRAAFTDADRLAHYTGLNAMDVAVESVLAANSAMLALMLGRLKVDYDVCLGHSTGETSAAIAAGIIPPDPSSLAAFSAGMHAAWLDAEATNEIPKAALFAVGAGRGVVDPILADIAEEPGGAFQVAMDNCPHQTVLAGPAEGAPLLGAKLEAAGVLFEVLPFDRAVHTSDFEVYAESLRTVFDKANPTAAHHPMWSCTTSAPYPDDPAAIVDLMVEHWKSPVEFTRTVEKLHAEEGVGVFIECGARGILTAFVDDILRGENFVAVSTDAERRSGVAQLNRAVAQLVAQAVPMDLPALYQGRTSNPDFDLDSLPVTRPVTREMEIKLLTSYVELMLEDLPQSLQKILPGLGGTPEGFVRIADLPDGLPEGLPAATGPSSQTNGNGTGTGNGADGAGNGAPTDGSTSNRTSSTADVGPHGHQAPVGPTPVGQAPAADVGHFAEPLAGVEPEYLSERAATMQSHYDLVAQIVDAHTQVTHARLARSGAEDGFDQPVAPMVPAPMADTTPTSPPVPAPTGRPAPAASASPTARTDSKPAAPAASRKAGARPPAAGRSDDQARQAPIVESIRRRRKPKMEDIARQVHPWLGLATEWEPGQRLVTVSRLTNDSNALHHHRLGGLLAVMPLALSASLLAQAAADLLPDQHLVGLRNLQGHRWMTVDDQAGAAYGLTAEVVGTADGLTRVSTRMVSADGFDTDNMTEVASAEILLAPEAPASTQPVVPVDAETRPTTFDNDRLYLDVLFHGPAWQGVTAVSAVGDRSIQADMVMLDNTDLNIGRWRRPLALDPITLDAAGQLIGFWTCDQLDQSRVVFPYHLERLDLFGPRPEVGDALTGRADIDCDTNTVQSDIEVLRGDGTVWMRLKRWADRRFDLPAELEDLGRGTALGEQASDAWNPIGGLPEDVSLRRLDVPPAVQQPLWLEIWQMMLLDRIERLELGSDNLPPKRKAARLASRTAAKEAVAVLGLDGMTSLLDIAFRKSEVGLPRVVRRRDPEGTDPAEMPSISMTSSERAGVAALRRSGPIGVDIEALRELESAVIDSSFDDAEKARIADAGGDHWALRCWCAKEAVGKAIGTALPRGPRQVTVVDIDPDRGRVTLTLRGDLAEQRPDLVDARLIVDTAIADDLVVAVCLAETEAPTGKAERAEKHDHEQDTDAKA